jgi:hypothetical protein
MIQESDRLIINQLEGITIPLLEGNIQSMAKQETLNKENTDLEVEKLNKEVKFYKSKNKYWLGAGTVIGIIVGIVVVR